METWYKTGGWKKEIEAVQVDRSSKSSVWLSRSLPNGKIISQRHNIVSSWDKFFKTYEAAKLYLIEKESKRVTAAERGLEEANKSLSRMKALKP